MLIKYRFTVKYLPAKTFCALDSRIIQKKIRKAEVYEHINIKKKGEIIINQHLQFREIAASINEVGRNFYLNFSTF